MENTHQNYLKFARNYIGENVETTYHNGDKHIVKTTGVIANDIQFECPPGFGNYDFSDDIDPFQLKDISMITDEDALQVAQYAHQQSDGFVVRRMEHKYDFLIHIERLDDVGITYHTSINHHGHINCNMHFSETPTEKFKSYKVNIGEVQLSSQRPIPFVAIIDFLRSKGYAMPWMELSVKKMVEYGWIKLVTND